MAFKRYFSYQWSFIWAGPTSSEDELAGIEPRGSAHKKKNRTLLNFLKSCKHFLHISIFCGLFLLLLRCFFHSEIFLRAPTGMWGARSVWLYIFRTCFSTFVMTGSNWVLSKLYIIFHNIFFLAQIVRSVPVNDVARRANSLRHEFHVTQRLVSISGCTRQPRVRCVEKYTDLVLLAPFGSEDGHSLTEFTRQHYTQHLDILLQLFVKRCHSTFKANFHLQLLLSTANNGSPDRRRPRLGQDLNVQCLGTAFVPGDFSQQ